MPQHRTERARDLRRDSTPPEKAVWELLRAKRMDGVKFRRQHPIGPCFADFACVSRKLVIEIDGEHHAFRVDADARRTAVMQGLGWRVVRFAATYVLEDREAIWAEIDQLPGSGPCPPSPGLSPRYAGGEEHELCGDP